MEIGTALFSGIHQHHLGRWQAKAAVTCKFTVGPQSKRRPHSCVSDTTPKERFGRSQMKNNGATKEYQKSSETYLFRLRDTQSYNHSPTFLFSSHLEFQNQSHNFLSKLHWLVFCRYLQAQKCIVQGHSRLFPHPSWCAFWQKGCIRMSI